MGNLKQGFVYIFYRGEILASDNYDSASERKKIIKRWEHDYRHQWGSEFFIQINPDYDLTRIDKYDGTNIDRRRKYPRDKAKISNRIK